jgi:hypothetical protein
MIIHLCLGCGKISINRVAADDDPGMLSVLCEESLELPECLRSELAQQGIQPLDSRGFDAAYFQIFGRQAIAVELAGIRIDSLVD